VPGSLPSRLSKLTVPDALLELGRFLVKIDGAAVGRKLTRLRAARCLARVTWSGSSTTVATHPGRVSSLWEPPDHEQGKGCSKQHE
jgi:hypothetical protein